MAAKAAKTAKTDVALVKELESTALLIVIMVQRVKINIKIKRVEKF